jgi:tRNA (guanosine-2'-O-)-methyltransferase
MAARMDKINAVIEKRQPNITVVLENVFDPHNISAVMRSCDSVGIGEIHIINTQVPKKVEWGFRSSAGSWKWIKTHWHTTPAECVKNLKKQYNSVFAAHLTENATSLYKIDFTEPLAIVFGNEQNGCSAEMLAACDGSIVIPQVGMVQSLNISVACGIILYEAYRQKEVAGHYQSPQLSIAAMEDIRTEWTDFKNIHELKTRKA